MCNGRGIKEYDIKESINGLIVRVKRTIFQCLLEGLGDVDTEKQLKFKIYQEKSFGISKLFDFQIAKTIKERWGL